MQNAIRSIGIIMDGNRRWAREKGLPAFEGHREGFENLRRLWKEFPRLQRTYGIECVFLYAFSTENWNRAKDEVEFLVGLFGKGLSEILSAEDASKEDAVRVRILGERERFSPQLQKLIADAEAATAENAGGTVAFCISYGGRAEILEAANRLIGEGRPVSEEDFSKTLWSAGLPDPDLIIRTSGEKRLSGFLTWESVYSELFFTDTKWPDFSAEELEKIFAEFGERERRHGA